MSIPLYSLPRKYQGVAAAAKARDAAKPANRYSAFPLVCVQFGLPKPVAEHKFHQTRKWRFDFAWPEYKVALEVEGAVWTNGRHTRGSGFVRDMEKYNEAAKLGWRIIRTTPDKLMVVATIQTVRETLEATP